MRQYGVIFGFCIFMMSVVAFGGEIVLKLGHGAPPDNPRHIVAMEFADAVREKSGGRLVIEVFPSEGLGTDRQMIESIVMGANPAPFAFGELYLALQQGQFDGQENPVTNIYFSKLYEVQKYLSVTNHKYEYCPLVISMRSWNKLPADLQQILKDAAVEYAGKHRVLNTRTNEELLDKMVELGLQVNQADIPALREACQPVYKEFEPVFGKDLIDRVLVIATK